jgi:hypothetical protein
LVWVLIAARDECENSKMILAVAVRVENLKGVIST